MTKLRILFLIIAVFVLALPLQAQDVDINELTFARDITRIGLLPVQADDVFPDTLEVVYATIAGEGLEQGDEIDIVWIFDGDELDTFTYENPNNDGDFRIWASWSDPDGLDDGDWAVEIVYDGDVIAEAEFEVTNDEYIFPIRFGSNCTYEDSRLLNEGVEFEEITYLYAYVEYANFDDETVTVIWQDENGEIPLEGDLEVVFDGEGALCIFYQDSVEFIRSGSYSMLLQDEDGDEYRESDEVDVED
ncbi:MAG: hypothetical protein Phog2KO_27380 [Phototrophicaceae bacterium]